MEIDSPFRVHHQCRKKEKKSMKKNELEKLDIIFLGAVLMVNSTGRSVLNQRLRDETGALLADALGAMVLTSAGLALTCTSSSSLLASISLDDSWSEDSDEQPEEESSE